MHVTFHPTALQGPISLISYRSLAVCWIVDQNRFAQSLSSAFSVLSHAQFGAQDVITAISLTVFLWDSLVGIDFSNQSLIHFLDFYQSPVQFNVRLMNSSIISQLKSPTPLLSRTVLLGRFFIQDFVSADLIMHIDADVWMTKPWLLPLLSEISHPNQSGKLLWGGRDRGLLNDDTRTIIAQMGIQPEGYINAGFFVFRNVPEAVVCLKTAVRLLQTLSLAWLDQTALNIAFNLTYKGFLSERFEKWHYLECKPWTINCHGVLPAVEGRMTRQMESEYAVWRSMRS
jgi:hypothetical protein